MPPEELDISGWPGLVNGVIIHTQAPTCNGKVFDYFIVDKGLYDANMVAGIVRMTNGGFAPQLPIRLLLLGDGRRKLVRSMKRPTRIPGKLPAGPLPQCAMWQIVQS